ncbi:histidine biosynthesis bifunctional protein hisIE, chloroplastic [Cinnamomum micranthum f. kanehirae]|uniref:phosphoribosyl-AMP cyclohydrolase n=1 Tax=Cinnamomum micranthum f. kanehirae TaxID=337451 RepID=A0A3S3MYT9_9MAGN|nr:histidine biosynthesis bifunctional protein hisIE, chloroplastic [Cinnamomum micranthum f. kanehirae]
MGEAIYVLGIKITHDRLNRLLTLSQESYLETVLKRFDRMMCKPIDTPISKSEKLSSKQGPTTEEDKAMMRGKSCDQVVRSIMYAMLCTRPDVAFVMGLELMADTLTKSLPTKEFTRHVMCMGLKYILCTLAHLSTMAFVPCGRLLGKLCGPTAIGPMPDRAWRCAADELPISLDLVQSDKDQTLCDRVWIKFRLPVGRYPTLVRRCEIPEGVGALLDSVKWDEKGLAVAIAQNIDTGAVLMQGFANKEALATTISSRKATFYSRSRSSLWTKGETSTNFINVHDIFLDCDRDSIIDLGKPDGPTCHTSSETCYFLSVFYLLNDSQMLYCHLLPSNGLYLNQAAQNRFLFTTLYFLESTITQREAEVEATENGKLSWTKRLLSDRGGRTDLHWKNGMKCKFIEICPFHKEKEKRFRSNGKLVIQLVVRCYVPKSGMARNSSMTASKSTATFELRNQSCAQIRPPTVLGDRELRYESNTRPPVLKADSEATVETGIARISRAT